jgi:hypothetical protein
MKQVLIISLLVVVITLLIFLFKVILKVVISELNHNIQGGKRTGSV